jgi:hypothetical protein
VTRWLLALSRWWHDWHVPINRVSDRWISDAWRDRRID